MQHIPTEEITTTKEPGKGKPVAKYKWLSFMSKVAVICNACSIFMIFASRWLNTITTNRAIQSTIITLGLLAFFINLMLQATLFILRVTKKEIPVAAWLRIFNMAAFGLQIVYYFIIPGK
jgi:hypothetical protein